MSSFLSNHINLNKMFISQNQMHRFDILLDVVDIVSFDLFDTLVQRNDFFSPKDLFYQVQEEVEKQLDIPLKDFTKLRVRAEEIARVRAWGHGLEEITLSKIYGELSRLLKLAHKATQKIQQIELECERSAITSLETGRQLYKAALTAGKTVIIVSDTYFEEKFINEILSRLGYADASKVYISSVYGKTKLEGSLYEIVLNDLRCSPAKILHIGDNQLTDVIMALDKGVRAILLQTHKHQFKSRHGLSDMPSGNLAISSMLCNVSKQPEMFTEQEELQSVLKQTAIENLSFLYLTFSTWLVEQLRNNKYERVYFAARDGLIMKRFFDIVAAAVGFEIDSRYLYVSRSTLYPSLVFTDPETARRQFSHSYDRLTLEDALERLSLNFEDCYDLLSCHGLKDREMRLDGWVNASAPSQFSAFMVDAWKIIESSNEEQFRLLLDYLAQEMVLTKEKAAFVDIGWHGSLQNCLLKLLNHLGIEKNFDGYYLGTFENPINVAPNFKAKGFLFDMDEPKAISALARSGVSLLELFHSAEHGCVLGFKRNSKHIFPILEENLSEQNQFSKIIGPIQKYAFDFVSEQLEQLTENKLQPSDPVLAARLGLRMLYAPTKTEALTFGRLRIATDFGSFMKSLTGALEWDLKHIDGETLPDGTLPMWIPGFRVLKNL